MSKRWLRERRQDAFYRRAKREGYRSRASYKLQQMDKRFNLLKEGDRVVDLGAAPGGWTQVAVDQVGDTGKVVGVDLAPIEPIEGATLLRGDMTDADTVRRVTEGLDGEADVVISDMSPNISGVYGMDQARSVHLAEAALRFATDVLRPGGRFVAKVFEGDLFQDYLDKVRLVFQHVKVHSPQASRNASSEVYVVARGFKGRELPGRREQGEDWREGTVVGDYREP